MSGRPGIGKQRVLDLLNKGERLCSRSASKKAFLSEREARAILREIHDSSIQTYICGWTRDGMRGPYRAQYSLGEGPDVERPKALTMVEKTERYRANMRKDIDKVEQMLDRRRTRSRVVKPDPIARSLFPWLYQAGTPVAPAEQSLLEVA